MPRAERQRLRRERAERLERLRRRAPKRLLRTIFQQRAALLENRARIEDLPELRALIRAARDSNQTSIEFSGLTFSVRRKTIFSAINTPGGRHIASFAGGIFDAAI
ncbi:MAG: hypothetical protein RBR52_00260 [Thiomonas sp.]|uniref:hypothetical protein n=1 Tax=Thiomonas sp. TaxID=2047785 RepID=UPI002A36C643|nr:hypothetical protein [Thiomonas sp.]MDY0328911.1 hypothetical protein [Thiomonas sp.]